jgi:hypothetical protein
MGIIELILVIVVIAVIVWAVTTYVPMDPKFKTLILVIALIVCCLIAARALGLGSWDVPANQLGR